MNYPAYITNLYKALDQGNINGARGTFDQIFASVEKTLKGYLARKHGSHWLETNGMDIVQSAGLKIWELLSAKRYDLAAGSNFTSWCVGILHNKYKDHWRKHSSCKEFMPYDKAHQSHADKAMQPDTECEQNENVLLIMEKVARLPEIQQAIVLDKIMEKTGVETAKSLGLTPVKVCRELKAARKTLSGYLP